MSSVDVVIADDDEVARVSLVRLLSRAPGLRVVGEVGDGAAALAMVRTLRPDVVVLDVHMPVMSGVEAARRLRAEGDRTPVVFMSADPDAAVAGLELEATTLLVKSVASLRETIEAVRVAAGVSRRRRRGPRAARPA